MIPADVVGSHWQNARPPPGGGGTHYILVYTSASMNLKKKTPLNAIRTVMKSHLIRFSNDFFSRNILISCLTEIYPLNEFGLNFQKTPFLLYMFTWTRRYTFVKPRTLFAVHRRINA